MDKDTPFDLPCGGPLGRVPFLNLAFSLAQRRPVLGICCPDLSGSRGCSTWLSEPQVHQSLSRTSNCPTAFSDWPRLAAASAQLPQLAVLIMLQIYRLFSVRWLLERLKLEEGSLPRMERFELMGPVPPELRLGDFFDKLTKWFPGAAAPPHHPMFSPSLVFIMYWALRRVWEFPFGSPRPLSRQVRGAPAGAELASSSMPDGIIGRGLRRRALCGVSTKKRRGFVPPRCGAIAVTRMGRAAEEDGGKSPPSEPDCGTIIA
ncbi:hypothetical protein PAPYR_8221 [Paratrimastix pyriformis]|uniref:Uncharacterized protein n=1 Tax=Paratrimastix pyriformis TaxID=342808 RepID=A0ABQ8UB11_9EUKA|nr:hypothetical protein PAPYR_8221 [Paratrimastix pyriformis]